jgi:tetratricopeptide (TPR) repeat protein
LVRATSYLKSYNFISAANDCKKLIEIKPNLAEGYFLSGFAENNLGNNNSAIIYFNKGLEIDSQSVTGYLGRGIVKYEMEKYSEAIFDFDKVIVLDSLNTKAYYYRGYTKYYSSNEYEGCIDLKKAAKLGLSDEENFNELDCPKILNNNKVNRQNKQNDKSLDNSSINSIKNNKPSLGRNLANKINSNEHHNQ